MCIHESFCNRLSPLHSFRTVFDSLGAASSYTIITARGKNPPTYSLRKMNFFDEESKERNTLRAITPFKNIFHFRFIYRVSVSVLFQWPGCKISMFRSSLNLFDVFMIFGKTFCTGTRRETRKEYHEEEEEPNRPDQMLTEA